MYGSNRDAGIENRLADTVGKERVGEIEKLASAYIHYHV